MKLNRTFTVLTDSSLLSLNSSSISDVVFLPTSPAATTSTANRLTDWQLLENEAKAVASSVVKSKREASLNLNLLGDIDNSIGSPLNVLDGSLNLLTGLDR